MTVSTVVCVYSHYGAQAVVVSIDPKRVYVSSPSDAPEGKTVIKLDEEDKGGKIMKLYLFSR